MKFSSVEGKYRRELWNKNKNRKAGKGGLFYSLGHEWNYGFHILMHACHCSPHYSQFFRFSIRETISTTSKRKHVFLISQMKGNVSPPTWSQPLHQLLWCHRHACSEPNLTGSPIGDLLNACILGENTNGDHEHFFSKWNILNFRRGFEECWNFKFLWHFNQNCGHIKFYRLQNLAHLNFDHDLHHFNEIWKRVLGVCLFNCIRDINMMTRPN